MYIYDILNTVSSEVAIKWIVQPGQPKYRFGSSKCIYWCHYCYRLQGTSVLHIWHPYGYISMYTKYFGNPSSRSREPGQWSPSLFLNKFNISVHFQFFGPIQHGIINTSMTKCMTLVGHSPKHPIYLAKKDILFTFFLIHQRKQQ